MVPPTPPGSRATQCNQPRQGIRHSSTFLCKQSWAHYCRLVGPWTKGLAGDRKGGLIGPSCLKGHEKAEGKQELTANAQGAPCQSPRLHSEPTPAASEPAGAQGASWKAAGLGMPGPTEVVGPASGGKGEDPRHCHGIGPHPLPSFIKSRKQKGQAGSRGGWVMRWCLACPALQGEVQGECTGAWRAFSPIRLLPQPAPCTCHSRRGWKGSGQGLKIRLCSQIAAGNSVLRGWGAQLAGPPRVILWVLEGEHLLLFLSLAALQTLPWTWPSDEQNSPTGSGQSLPFAPHSCPPEASGST